MIENKYHSSIGGLQRKEPPIWGVRKGFTEEVMSEIGLD